MCVVYEPRQGKVKRKYHVNLWFSGCSIYKKIPPATETLRDSNSPTIGMLTSSHTSLVFAERPLPSLPKTKHIFISAKESASRWDSKDAGFSSSLFSGWAARIFIWYLLVRASRWIQWPQTIGIWKEAPLLARSAFSLNGSQHPGSRKTPPCLDKGTSTNPFMLGDVCFLFWIMNRKSEFVLSKSNI